ncbi:hypothetical protein Cp4435_01877 [Clostridium perfringens]|uniref:ATP-binding protein n=1 Tax=Clostridium perfringens TaxID=1502 RepID=UPI002444BB1C|nr:ATP-binding protein [Clostridium perfringens]MDG6884704.1 hypothetical protein [Clostridium perfringens]
MKNKKYKVKVDKHYLRKAITGTENYGQAISYLVDNSIKAYESIHDNSDYCDITIEIFENLILIKDNSGGFKESISDEDIFRIGEDSGIGIKKSVFKFGNTIKLESNAKYGFRRLLLDFDMDESELFFSSEKHKANLETNFGTTIHITDLEEDVKNDIINKIVFYEVIEYLSKIFSKKLSNTNLRITIKQGEDKKIISPYLINGEFIAKKEIDNLIINLYKKDDKDKYEKKGFDLYINDYIVYKRKELDKLTESGYHYKNCIAEVMAYGDRNYILQNIKEIEKLTKEFIKDNSSYFKAKETCVQFYADSNMIEELKEKCDLKTAKEVGEKGFENLCNKYNVKKIS